MRATWQVGWQALYRAGDCSLDIRVEPELASSRAAVIGQISNHVRPEREDGGLPVRLNAGKLVVAETRSNGFGEFVMEYEREARLQLCIYLEDRSKRIPGAPKEARFRAGAEDRGLTSGRPGLKNLQQKPETQAKTE